jgi:hypothetical protein
MKLKSIALIAGLALLVTGCGTVSYEDKGNLKVVSYEYNKINYIPPSLKWKSEELCPKGYEIVKQLSSPIDEMHAKEIWYIKCQ